MRSRWSPASTFSFCKRSTYYRWFPRRCGYRRAHGTRAQREEILKKRQRQWHHNGEKSDAVCCSWLRKWGRGAQKSALRGLRCCVIATSDETWQRMKQITSRFDRGSTNLSLQLLLMEDMRRLVRVKENRHAQACVRRVYRFGIQ